MLLTSCIARRAFVRLPPRRPLGRSLSQAELPAAGGEDTSTRGTKQVSEVIANVQSLIGYFDLDPNRVLDLVLDALEAVPSRVSHRSLVSLFNPQYIPHILGFKFQFYQGTATSACPDSLFTLCGLLLQQGTVSLEQARIA